jgi:hypothetical protein
MIGWFVFAAATGASAVCIPVQPAPLSGLRIEVRAAGPLQAPRPATLRELYESGVAFGAFLEAASARRALWVRNSDSATVEPDLIERARSVPGAWRILAVAVDACSDSVNTIPYVAKLAELVPSLDLRIIDSTVGREIMEAYRTPDGRAATPTLLLIDADWNEAGCFVERPEVLQRWYAEREGATPVRELTQQKMEWYAEDAGRATLDEMVRMLERAAAGSPRCAATGMRP